MHRLGVTHRQSFSVGEFGAVDRAELGCFDDLFVDCVRCILTGPVRQAAVQSEMAVVEGGDTQPGDFFGAHLHIAVVKESLVVLAPIRHELGLVTEL
jgi:hypothetical protein